MIPVEETHEVYEPPTVTDAGDFAEVTHGLPSGNGFDGGLIPFVFYYPD